MREHKKSHIGMISWGMFLAGALSLGSCSSDETIDGIDMQGKAITFGSVTMENHSRAADPSYGDNKLIDGFQVWGTVKGNTNNTIQIFDGATVTRGNAEYGDAWACSETQYWIPNAEYNFMAIANATSVTTDAGIPTAIQYTANGTTDLLLGELENKGIKTVTTDASGTPSQNPVAFIMTHLLSKVHFSFQNGSGSAVTGTEITDIQVNGHYASGTYTIGAATPWGSPNEATSALGFGGLDADDQTATTSQYARLIIPGTQTWTVTFKMNGTEISKPLKLENYTFAPNTEYNIIVTLGIDLSLTVAVQDWEGVEIQNNFSDNVSVERGDEIKWEDVNPDAENRVVIDNLKKEASFTFRIAGPKGGTWNAMLVTQQGNPNAFTITPNQGEVGTEYTVKIQTNGDNNTVTANMAELRFVVRQGGKILPVDNLTTNGENYIIVQNPAIN